MSSSPPPSSRRRNHRFRFEATGSAARKRIAPLLLSSNHHDWVDLTTPSRQEEAERGTQDENNVEKKYNSTTCQQTPDFLWENAQSLRTKRFRDKVKAYSHLPTPQDLRKNSTIHHICIIYQKFQELYNLVI